MTCILGCDPFSSSSHGGSEADSSSGCGNCNQRSSADTVIESRCTTSHVDAEDVRRKRLAYLEANARRTSPATTSSGRNTKSQVNT